MLPEMSVQTTASPMQLRVTWARSFSTYNASSMILRSSTFCRRFASVVLRTVMSRIAAVTRVPSALSSGLSMISIGKALPFFRRPVSSMPEPMGRASASCR